MHFLDGAREIVLCHHERWDGLGYPGGVRNLEIPLGARLFPLCDAYDAMTTSRAYRPAMSVDKARAEIRRGSGSQFWPLAVDAFCSIPQEVLQIAKLEEDEFWLADHRPVHSRYEAASMPMAQRDRLHAGTSPG